MVCDELLWQVGREFKQNLSSAADGEIYSILEPFQFSWQPLLSFFACESYYKQYRDIYFGRSVLSQPL